MNELYTVRCDKQRKEGTDELEIVKDWEAGKIP